MVKGWKAERQRGRKGERGKETMKARNLGLQSGEFGRGKN
jgi:hypothetical protein